jgi:hypothetical protein
MLTVYLDSNDYSRFAELPKQSEAIRRTFDSLVRWVAEGRIIIRYSSVNVLEAAPLNTGSIHLAQARLEAIQLLCGKRCFVDVIRRLRSEAVGTSVVGAQCDLGDWHPSVHDLQIPGAATIARAMLENARSAMSRQQCRRFEAEYFDKQGKLRDTARPKVVAFRKSIGEPEFMKLPISELVRGIYFEFLLGRASRQQLIDALIDSFADLRRWGQWYEADWPLAHGITRSLRAPAEQLTDEVRRLARMLRLLFKAIQEGGVAKKEIQRRFDEKANPDAMRNKLIARVTRPGDPCRQRESYSWTSTPAFEVYSTVAMQVVRESAMRVSMPRQPLESDFVDCLHLCYAPFVDVFRADAYMVGVVNRCKVPLKTTFVAKIEDLPEVIRMHPNFSLNRLQ